jgi:branched-chain amino acid transport system substrate-binding protein
MPDAGHLRLPRRSLLKAGLTTGLLQIAPPFILRALGDTPVKVGMVNPITGVYSLLAKSEVEGAMLAAEEINVSGGILGRAIELLIEDSANDLGTGVEKTLKLINVDHVEFILGDLNSNTAAGMSYITNEKKKLHIVPGGHAGFGCKWNLFHVCNTVPTIASALVDFLVEKFGKRWYFLAPGDSFGREQESVFVRKLGMRGGIKVGGEFLATGTGDLSSALTKARDSYPDVLLGLLGGRDTFNLLRQFVELGLDKQMVFTGGLLELEYLAGVPDEARIGWWILEWYWNQPNIPDAREFDAKIRARTGQRPTARHWFGYVALHTVASVANELRTLDSIELARALQDFLVPSAIALQPGPVRYRRSDHQLAANMFIGEVQKEFQLHTRVAGEVTARAAEQAGCHLDWPA